jgi:hypothetical protein
MTAGMLAYPSGAVVLTADAAGGMPVVAVLKGFDSFLFDVVSVRLFVLLFPLHRGTREGTAPPLKREARGR